MSASACSDWNSRIVWSKAIPDTFFLEAVRGALLPDPKTGTPTAAERVVTHWYHRDQQSEALQELDHLISQHEAGIP